MNFSETEKILSLVRGLNPGHLHGRRVLYPLYHAPQSIKSAMLTEYKKCLKVKTKLFCWTLSLVCSSVGQRSTMRPSVLPLLYFVSCHFLPRIAICQRPLISVRLIIGIIGINNCAQLIRLIRPNYPN